MFGLGSGAGKKKEARKDAERTERDRLRSEALANAEDALLSTSGIPGTADALAVEPVQGLIGIATSDGKVKLLGRQGCELTLYSGAKYPYATRQLQFLQNRGVIMRVSKGGIMESWSVVAAASVDRGANSGARSLGTLKLRGDKIHCVADMPRDPYVLLGCASGCLRVAALVDAAGNPVAGSPGQARHFAVTPYKVRPEQLRGRGEVRQVAVQSRGQVHRALVLFTAGMAAVWDIRATQLLASIDPADQRATAATPSLAAAGQVTAVCWLGSGCSSGCGDYATGHVDGSVLVWALQGLGLEGTPAVTAVMRVEQGEAEPVRMLRCLPGGAPGLLVLGGQQVEQPEGLTLLPLPAAGQDEAGAEQQEGLEGAHAGGSGGEEEDQEEEEEEEEEEEDVDAGREAEHRRRRKHRAVASPGKRRGRGPVKLPWFGHVIGFGLVVDGGVVTGYEPPSGVLQLVEGGQLVLYSLSRQQPRVLTPPLQRRAAITATEAPLVPLCKPAACGPSTITLEGLRQAAADSWEVMEEAEQQFVMGMQEVCRSGTPPPPPEGATWGLVYCTGHKDGGVCLWDLHGGTSRLLCAAPAGEAAAADAGRLGGSSSRSSPGSVTCVSLAWPTGLLLAGHQRGEVRMYQFSASQRHVECVTLDSVNAPGVCRPLQQPAGLQLRLRVLVNSGEITCLAYCQSIRAVAAGDKSGGVALIDTARPLVRWYALPGQHPLLAAAVAPLPLPAARARCAEVAGEEGAPSHTVVVADSEGRLAALDASRGCFVGRSGPLQPKNGSYSLALELLDERCNPLWARRQMGAGCCQAALGVPGSGYAWEDEEDEAPGDEGDDDDDEEEEAQEQEEEALEGLSVEELLARAALQADGAHPPPPRSGRKARRKPRERSRRAAGGAAGALDAMEDGSSAPAATLSSCPDPTAHYVLLVSDQYLRLYSASHVLLADRATAAKRSPPAGQQLVYARPLQVAGAPGVMALAAGEHGLCVQVYSLPSLDLLHEAPLSASLSWFWDVPPGHERRLGRLVAASRLGHLLLLGLGNELITLGLAAGLPPAAAPLGLFDARAAAASLAAAARYEEAERLQPPGQREEGSQSAGDNEACERDDGAEGSQLARGTEATRGHQPSPPRLPASAGGGGGGSGASGEAPRDANVVLSRVFTRVQQGLTRGVRQLASNVERGVASVQAAWVEGAGAAGGGAAAVGGGPGGSGPRLAAAAGPRNLEWYAALPQLAQVLACAPPEADSAGGHTRGDSSQRHHHHRQHQQRTRGSAGGRLDDDDDDEDEDISVISMTDEDEEEGPTPAQHRGSAAGTRTTAAAPPQRFSQHQQQQQHPQQHYPQQQQPYQQQHPVSRSAGGDEASLRADLFGGVRPHASAGGAAGPAAAARSAAGPAGSAGKSQPRTRTADEIKRAYGRAPAEGGRAGAAAARTNDLRAVMEENRARLEERGERLRQLNDKTADLENSAAGFAEMARQLAERERNKKWWQL